MLNMERRPKWNRLSGRLGLVMPFVLITTLWSLPASGEQKTDQTNIVTSLKAEGENAGAGIVIATSRRPDASVFTLSSPSRLVVDIANATPTNLEGVVNLNKGPAKEATVKQFTDAEGTITRVTIFLDSVIDYTSEITDKGIILHLKNRSNSSGAEVVSDDKDPIANELSKMKSSSSKNESVANTVAKSVSKVEKADVLLSKTGLSDIVGLDFLPYENKSRVQIRSNSSLKYKVSSLDRDNQVVFDIQNATLAKILTRPLDTSEFPSAVKMISAYPSKDNSDNVRVVIKLRESVKYKISEDTEQGLSIDFPVPEGIAQIMAQKQDNTSSNDELSSQLSSFSYDAFSLVGADNNLTPPPSINSGDALVMYDNTPKARFTGRKISIDVREADIHNVFRMISNVSKLNIVTGEDVKGKVTLRLEGIPWDQVLAIVLKSKDLGAVRYGNIIRIAPYKQLKEERDAQIKEYTASRALAPLETLVLTVNYATASEMSEKIKSTLSERGTVTIDERTNTMIIEDESQVLSRVSKLISHLDTQTPQVMIEARLVEVSTSFVHEVGIQWGGQMNATANNGTATGLYFPNWGVMTGGQSTTGTQVVARNNAGQPNWVVDLPSSGSTGSLALSLGSIADAINLDARLSAIETMGKGKVISAPKVTTLDNREATISQGSQIPYTSTSTTGGTQVSFKDATLKLTVTPHITQDQRVFMKVSVNNDRPDFGQSINGQPSIAKKEAKTEVLVKDGDTTVLGGVFSLSEDESFSGVPGAHKIPFLGWLFKSKKERMDRKELLVFITPRILNKKS